MVGNDVKNEAETEIKIRSNQCSDFKSSIASNIASNTDTATTSDTTSDTTSNTKSKPKTIRNNAYFAKKMKQSRHRRKKQDKLFYKKFVYTVDIGNKKYVFLSKPAMNIQRIHKDVLKSHDDYILTF